MSNLLPNVTKAVLQDFANALSKFNFTMFLIFIAADTHAINNRLSVTFITKVLIRVRMFFHVF